MSLIDAAGHATADLPPMLIRAVVSVAAQRGIPVERLCRGLGFYAEDLTRADLRVSYRQTRRLLQRAYRTLADPALGLAAGTSQTLVSWGLPGLAMLACRTLGDAVAFCIQHQREVGALLAHRIDATDAAFAVEAVPRFFDPEFEPLLIEESFAAIVTIVRGLVGADFAPVRVEFAFARPAHVDAYRRVFRCPVHFGCVAHRLLAAPHWLRRELPSWDRFSADAVREAVASLQPDRERQVDLVESAIAWLRANIEAAPGLPALARHLSLGERTLRRRLGEQGTAYRELLDRVRRERALELLHRGAAPTHALALATGFEDARNFRRAFKRWTGGALPADLRR